MTNNKEDYKDRILNLVKNSPLDIDTDIVIKGRIPTSVSSEFITNKEQGDWAERIVYEAINNGSDYVAVHYGRSDSLSAGDEGFKEFYLEYQAELNSIGKRPDLLIFNRSDYYEGIEKSVEGVKKAVCAIEVRSSSFLVNKYNNFMQLRNQEAVNKINKLKQSIFENPTLNDILKSRKPAVYDVLKNTSIEEFKEGVTFRFSRLSSSPELISLSEKIKEIKECIKVLQKRDYLSITPKLEDLALVNRWIENFNVPHYYLQVFFDKAYMISFEDILTISSDPNNEGIKFSIERDSKNQMKTTIKIDIRNTDLIIDQVKIPDHQSQMKELDRGRVLFYVKFDGSSGYLEDTTLESILK